MNDDLESVTHYIGDTAAIGFAVRDAAGQPVDVTGYSFRLSVGRARHPASVAELIATFSATVLDGPNGLIGFTPGPTWAAAQPQDFVGGVASYFYDVEQTDSPALDVHTFGVGRFYLKRGISS